jgi:hypothetical protein
MAANNWIALSGNSSGSWSVTGHWSLGHAPISTDDITINLGGASFAVLIDVSSSIHSLSLSGASVGVNELAGSSLTIATNLSIQGFSYLALNNANTIAGTTTVSSATLDIGATGALGASTVSLLSGAMRAQANATLANTINVGGAFTIAASPTSTLTLTGNLNLSNSFTKLTLGAPGYNGVISMNLSGDSANAGSTIELAGGAVQLSGGQSDKFASLLGSASSTTIDAGATLDLNGSSASIANLQGSGQIVSSRLPTSVTINGGLFSGTISGSVSVSLGGVTLTGVNSYIGVTNFVSSAGATTLSNAGALGAGPIIMSSGANVLTTVSMTLNSSISISGFDNSASTFSIAANDGTTLTINGPISFAPASQQIGGVAETLVVGGGAGQHGAINLGPAAAIYGFTNQSAIDLKNVTYAAGEHMVWQSTANGVQRFALEDAGNNILSQFSFGERYSAALLSFSAIPAPGAYSAAMFNVADDGSGHALLTIASGLHGPTPFVDTHDVYSFIDSSCVVLQNGGSMVDWVVEADVAVAGIVIGSGLTGWNVVGCADFNGDGVSDVLVQNGVTVVDWTMKGASAVSGAALGVASAGYSVVGVGDFNGDGVADVVLQNGDVVVDWIVQNGIAVSGSVLGSNLGGFSVVGTGDFNGDGVSDILLANGAAVVVWDMAGGKVANGFVIGALPGGASVVGTGDFNGDGTTDIVLQTGGNISDWIIHNNAIAWTNTLGVGLTGCSVASTGDYNGDGTSDSCCKTAPTWLTGPCRGAS